MHYLIHLANLGSTNLHAFGYGATKQLKSSLALESCRRVLEIGCGTGETSVGFAMEAVTVVGIDLLHEMLRIARFRMRLLAIPSNLARADVVNLPFEDQSFDAVFTESVLGIIHPQERAQSALTEIQRVLRPGGRYVANEGFWKAGTPPEIVSRISRLCKEDFGFAPVNFDQAGIIDAITAAGFSSVRAELFKHENEEISRRLWRSQLLTRGLELRSWLDFNLRNERRHYRRLLDRHRDDGEHFDVRLFIATK